MHNLDSNTVTTSWNRAMRRDLQLQAGKTGILLEYSPHASATNFSIQYGKPSLQSIANVQSMAIHLIAYYKIANMAITALTQKTCYPIWTTLAMKSVRDSKDALLWGNLLAARTHQTKVVPYNRPMTENSSLTTFLRDLQRQMGKDSPTKSSKF